MNVVPILVDAFLWYIKLVRSTLPVIQLVFFTFGTLAFATAILYLVSVRRTRRYCTC